MNVTTSIRTVIYIGVLGLIVIGGAMGIRYVQGELSLFVVQSGSMQPTLEVGSVILTVPVPSARVGDVVTYRTAQGAIVTHRVFDVLEKDGQVMYVTKGDANHVEDDVLVAPSMLIGKVNFAIPSVGLVFALVKTLPGYIVLVIIPGLYLFLRGALQLREALLSVSVKTT